MWCPEGYFLLAEILEKCHDLAQGELDHDLWGADFDRETEQQSRETTARAYWLFLNFMEKNEGKFCATLSTGVVVKLSGRVTEPYFPIDDVCPKKEKEINAFLRHAFEPFALFEIYHGVIDLDTDPKRINRLFGGGWYESLRPLNGAPICWKLPAQYPSLTEALRAATVVVEEPNIIDRPKGGRTMVRQKASEEFWDTYPRGLEEVSLSEAARRLNYDRKTLREGLKEFGNAGRTAED